MIGAKREIAPQVLMLLQHFAHVIRALEARMRPQDARLGILPEQPLECVAV
jgi:hypothetical protein